MKKSAKSGTNEKKRCFWANPANPLYLKYHDQEWGRPSHDERHLFEMLCLEGAQAGLSWETILNKREAYREAFFGFDPVRCARLTDARLQALLQEPGIVRNRLKVRSVRENARAFLQVQREFGSFDRYLWGFASREDLRANAEKVSVALSRELKKRGFRFVGGTICYSFMQAVGLVNDHLPGCYLHRGRRR